MKITCKICGIVDKPHNCPHIIRKTDRRRIDNKVYESKEYRKARADVMKEFDTLCLWSLFVEGKTVRANRTHHIIEVLDDITKSKDKDNLIPVRKDKHELIHKLYLISPEIKKEIQKILFEIKELYMSGKIEFGVFKKEILKYTPHL